jgi:hypothetical protein
MHDPEEFALSKLPKKMVSPLMLILQKCQILHPDYKDQIISLKKFALTSTDRPNQNTGEALVKKLVETDTHRGVKFSNTHPEVAKMVGYE